MRNLVYIIFILFTLSGCKKLKLAAKYHMKGCPCDAPVSQSDFPQEFLDVDLPNYYKKLQSPLFKFDTLGIVDYNEQQYIIPNLKFKGSEAKRKLLILTGVHGNETGGVLAIPFLLDSIESKPNKFKNWEIDIITPVNPIGVINRSRYNKNGCDLNRKMHKSQETEIRLQLDHIDAFNPDLIISLHEAPSENYFIFPGPHLDLNILEGLTAHLKNEGITLAKQDYFGRALELNGVSNTNKGFINFMQKLINVQPLDDQLKKSKIPSLTPESGWNSKNLDQRVKSHLLLMLYMLEHY
jgi:hypothetical protein